MLLMEQSDVVFMQGSKSDEDRLLISYVLSIIVAFCFFNLTFSFLQPLHFRISLADNFFFFLGALNLLVRRNEWK